MHQEQESGSSGSGDRSVAAVNKVDAFVAAALLLLGLVVTTEARKLGAGWTSDGPGAGYFPFYVGVIICISALGVLYQSLLGKSRDTSSFVSRRELGRVLSVLLPAAVYVAVVQVLGLYVASALYIALFMIVLGKYSPVKSVVIALGVNTVFFLAFEVWFKVPLFKGMLNPLGFLGY